MRSLLMAFAFERAFLVLLAISVLKISYAVAFESLQSILIVGCGEYDGGSWGYFHESLEDIAIAQPNVGKMTSSSCGLCR